MAKVGDIRYEFDGLDLKAPVNCNSSGEFSVALPEIVVTTLGLPKKITGTTLGQVTAEFNAAIARFKTSTTTEELVIAIKYSASGGYTLNVDGHCFTSHEDRSKYQASSNGYSEWKNMLSLDFEVLLRRTVNGTNEKFFQTHKGRFSDEDPNKYYPLSNTFRKTDGVKIIPYSEEALATLLAAHEKIRAASETLYNFITLDEAQIIDVLTNQKLLK